MGTLPQERGGGFQGWVQNLIKGADLLSVLNFCFEKYHRQKFSK